MYFFIKLAYTHSATSFLTAVISGSTDRDTSSSKGISCWEYSCASLATTTTSPTVGSESDLLSLCGKLFNTGRWDRKDEGDRFGWVLGGPVREWEPEKLSAGIKRSKNSVAPHCWYRLQCKAEPALAKKFAIFCRVLILPRHTFSKGEQETREKY